MAKARTSRALYKIRLKTGQHTWRDYSKPILDPDGNPTGKYDRGVANVGETFDSPTDLSKREPDRYELVGGTEAAQAAKIADLERQLVALRALQQPASGLTQTQEDNPAVTPGGIVTSGWQKSSGKHSGAMTLEEAGEHGANVGEYHEGGGRSSGYSDDSSHPDDPNGDGLDDMTKADLRVLCEQEGVHVPANLSKADHIDAIRKNRQAAADPQ